MMTRNEILLAARDASIAASGAAANDSTPETRAEAGRAAQFVALIASAINAVGDASAPPVAAAKPVDDAEAIAARIAAA